MVLSLLTRSLLIRPLQHLVAFAFPMPCYLQSQSSLLHIPARTLESVHAHTSYLPVSAPLHSPDLHLSTDIDALSPISLVLLVMNPVLPIPIQHGAILLCIVPATL